MKLFKFLPFLFLITLLSCKETKEKKEIIFKNQLQSLFPKAQIDSIKIKNHFTEAYQVVLEQNLNPKNPSEGTFKHYMYVSHTDYKNPTVIITDGYASKNRTTELSKLLKSNQVIVEYRMYGKSRPDSIPWKYLTNDNAIEDYHTIVSKLKKLYKGKWLSSGISKGGETTLIYKSKYPNDVDVAVPYVAPLINGLEDIRTTNLINSVGTKECRDAIKNFQRAILKNRTKILKHLATYAEENKMSFTEVSQEEALEYSVLEFPFSFWQWGGKCNEIPSENATSKEFFDYLVKVSGFGLYNDWGFNYYLPSFYQHIKELGYYGFDLEPVKDLLKIVTSSSNMRFAPKNVDLLYNENYIKDVRDFVENKGNNILYIYGAYDPWGACAPTPKPNIDALKMVLADADHGTRIKHFSKEDQQKIYNKLQNWLGKEVKLYPVK
ncbi:S28 family serine protease [uncultured Tenacibaculum sp.]|uniref:S28 family serine protease n=1 Tax=uncultured Tenacibaculum sp. TaxID=174713 RepID=UPI002639352C|nr:S28 family serine protease [uncultured Tenacibaculum sp.]